MTPDDSVIAQIEKRLKSATGRLHQLAAAVGHAKQVREFAGDRKKNLLAKYVVRALKAGETSTAAETIGRADPSYQSDLEALASDSEQAETVIAQWSAEMASFEAARSLLSMQKESLRLLEG